ncbi:MAG: site-specific integrase [Planctomycetota bacterium]|jgi:hypothetical protein
MEDTHIVQEFLNYLKFERRFSEHTAKCYGADLVQFGEFLTERSGDASVTGGGIPGPHEGGSCATAVATQTDTKSCGNADRY